MASQPAGPPRGSPVIFAIFAVLGVIACLRLVELQVFMHRRLDAERMAQSARDVRVPARRGPILDRHGTTLVASRATWSVYLQPRLIHPGDREHIILREVPKKVLA